MSRLSEFLIANPVEGTTEEVIVSNRLKDYPFTIKAIDGKDFAEYQRAATAIGKKKKASFDSKLFNELVVLNHTVEPNFRDSETLKAANCMTPEQFLYKSLLAGEISTLADKISTLSGFDTDIEEDIEEAKNS